MMKKLANARLKHAIELLDLNPITSNKKPKIGERRVTRRAASKLPLQNEC